jgi:hypothetical protein
MTLRCPVESETSGKFVQAVQKVLSPAHPSASPAAWVLAIWDIDAPNSCHYSP